MDDSEQADEDEEHNEISLPVKHSNQISQMNHKPFKGGQHGPQNSVRAPKIPKFWREKELPVKPNLKEEVVSRPESTEELVFNDSLTTRRQSKAFQRLGVKDPIKDFLKPDQTVFKEQSLRTAKQSFEINCHDEVEPEAKVVARRAPRSPKRESWEEDDDESYDPSASKMLENWGKISAKRKSSSQSSAKGKPRGNYNMLNLDQRLQILTYARRFGIDAAHKKYKICKSRIRRYIHNGADRKKGGGRKTLDPSMETNLLNWIETSTRETSAFPSRCIIKDKAKDLSRVDNFLASKGWCDKFFKRNFERLETIRQKVKPNSDFFSK